MISLVAADAHPIYLLGLRQFFSSQSNIKLMACCTSAEKLRLALKLNQPDILMLDLNLEDCPAIELIRELGDVYDVMKFIILTDHLDDEETIQLLQLNVQGIFLKKMPVHLLINCVQKVASGKQWVESSSIQNAFGTMLRREAGTRRVATILTARETEVMKLVSAGFSNSEIAEKLIVQEGTVKIHIHNIYRKLGIKNRVDLTLYAQKRGIV